MKKIYTIIIAILWFVQLFGNGTGKFQIIGNKIIDPEGNEFIPIGTNVQGMKWVWPGDIVPQASLIADAWNFNIIRVNCKLYDGFWNGQNVSINAAYQTIESMQAIVDAYTPKKVVVMFEFHDETGGYYTGSRLEDLKDAYRELCDLWADNTYVWFNIMNEPGGSTADLNLWVSMHQAVIEVIRDEKEADNIIVVDNHFWGQDLGNWNTNLAVEGNSSVLTRGNDLLHFNNKDYANIMFSTHVYDQWNSGSLEQIEFKMIDYIIRVKEKDFAIMIGEYATNNTLNTGFPNAFKATMNVSKAHGIGLVWWHWFGGDEYKLTTTGNGNGGNINSTTNPTNLTWPGKMVWDRAHFDGNTSISIQGTSTSKVLSLELNYPNPVEVTTTIKFSTGVAGQVKLTILNVWGTNLEVLLNDKRSPGNYSLEFSPGGRFTAGIYFFRLELNQESVIKSFIIK